MAYGQFTGYEPGPVPDSLRFTQQGGPPLLVTGPQAAALKARIDASQQFAPVALAQNAPPSTGGVSSVADAMQTYPDEASAAAGIANEDARAAQAQQASTQAQQGLAPPQLQGREDESQLMSVAPPGTPAAPAAAPIGQATVAPGSKAVPLFQSKTGEVIYGEPGADFGAPQNLYKRTPAVAGSPGGILPSTIKVKGGARLDSMGRPIVDPNDLAALRENSIDTKLAYQTAYDLHAENMAEQRATLDAQADANRVAAKEAMARQQAQQAKVDTLQGQYDQAKNDYANSGIDPNRAMKGVGGWLAVIGSALGAYGAAITKSPNFAQQFVNQQIANDIRAQEAAIKIKGDKQQTLLGDLNRQLGSLDLAKTAYTGVMLQESKRRLEVLANHAATREAAASYVQGAAALDAQLQANDVAFRKAASDNVETEFRYHAPTAGHAAQRVPLTLEEAEKARTVTKPTKANVKKEDAEHAVNAAMKLNEQVGRDAGFVLNPETDQWEEGPHSLGTSDWLADKVGYETEQRKSARLALKNYVPVKAHALGERPPPLHQIHEAVGGYLEGRTSATLRQQLNEDRQAFRSGVAPTDAAAVPANEEEPEDK